MSKYNNVLYKQNAMKKNILLFTLVFFFLSSNAQYRKGIRSNIANHQIGFSIGAANYLGDLANKGGFPIFSEINSKAFRPTLGLNYRNNFTYYSSFNAEILYAQITGDDANTKSDPYPIKRNIHFRTDIIDISAMIEWNFIPYEIGSTKRRVGPYFGIGISGFYFNPQAELNGQWVDLQPLGTEGQGIIPETKKYSRFNLAIPVSTGIKYNITKQLAIGFEIQYRVTFTDYLDDVSSASYVSEKLLADNYDASKAAIVNQLAYRAIDPDFSPRDSDYRGNPTNNDHYFLMMVSVAYRIPTDGRFFPKMGKK